MVASAAGPSIPKVRWIVAPRWLSAVVGVVPARLATFLGAAVWKQPDVVGGFHLLVNGLVALVAGRLIGARTWYFCVGGPTELVDGGVHGENPYFVRLKRPDPVVERRLLQAAGRFDAIITMGTRAVRFFRARGLENGCYVVPGGVDAPAGCGSPHRDEFDVVLVARLAAIKRIDVFLRAVACAAERRPSLRAAIVGDGPLREPLQALARKLEISGHVTFAGQQHDVGAWLARSRVFMLTSASEGLALSLIEAMACGLPAVVPDVGDLRDLVSHEENGLVIADPTPEAYADALLHLLDEPERHQRFSAAARRAAHRYSVAAAIASWDALLAPKTTPHS